MKEFLNVLRRFVPPYKKYLVLSVVFNILSAVLNIFSFAALIPILQILFQTGDAEAATSLMAWDWQDVQAVLMNNLNYYVTQLIAQFGQTTTLLLIGLFLALTTALKTGAYFLSSATIIPIRTGVVRDIRNQLYQKITSLPLGFFSEERKGDIIARMSGDVQEVESSIMSSLDMLFKNPILIVVYFATLLFVSWQLTLFTIVFVPIFGWFMGIVGRKLKQKSIKAQALPLRAQVPPTATASSAIDHWASPPVVQSSALSRTAASLAPRGRSAMESHRTGLVPRRNSS